MIEEFFFPTIIFAHACTDLPCKHDSKRTNQMYNTHWPDSLRRKRVWKLWPEFCDGCIILHVWHKLTLISEGMHG